jgi:hypothetical protein
MAISTTRVKSTAIGDLKAEVFTGSFASGDTTGTVATGFTKVLFAIAQYEDSSAKVMNCSSSGGTITIDTEDPGATKTFTLLVIGM